MIIDQKQQQGAVKASFPAQRDWSETSSFCRARLRQIADTVPLLIRFCGFMDHSPALAFIKDAQGRYVYVNRAFERLFGARVLGRTDFDLLPESTAKQLQYDDLLVLASGGPRQFVEAVPTPDGTPHDWLVVKFPFRDAQGAGYVGGMAVDVTERVQAERALRESERRFHALARISPVGIFCADLAGNYMYVNDRWCEIAGLTAGEALGEGWARSLHPEDRERAIGQWYRAVAGKRPFAAEYRVLRPDGAWVFGQSIPEERGRKKSVTGYVGTITDITEQRRSQEQLRAFSSHLQDTLEIERTRIAQEIHDELGALLTAIKMDLSFCLEEAGATKGFLSEKLYQAMTRVDTAAQAVRKIAAGLRPSILDDFGLWAAIEWLAQDFQERTGIPCELSMDVPYVSVRRDRATAIFRILQEALTNVARHAQASRVSITVQAPGNDLRVEVTDNGKGIPSERIHDPQSFGLRCMFERAAALGGEVRIHGTPGQGTRVAIRLPLEETRGEKP